MFTGIIKELAQIKCIIDNKSKLEKKFIFKLKSNLDNIEIGQSISINGVCQSITDFNLLEKEITIYSSPETLDITTFASFTESQYVNIEYPLRLSDFLNGHLLQGHIDTTAEILEIEKQGESHCIRFRLKNTDFFKYLSYKGSIAVDGVSLTLNEISHPGDFKVMIIPITWEKTIFPYYKIANKVNIETDCIAKYLDRLSIFN